jgi:hypothetical protein
MATETDCVRAVVSSSFSLCRHQHIYTHTRVCVYVHMYIKQQSLYRPRGFQEVEAPRFRYSWHVKVAPATFIPQEIFLVPISVKRLGRPQGHGVAGRIISGIEPTTFWLVVQCLNQLCHFVPAACVRISFSIQVTPSSIYGIDCILCTHRVLCQPRWWIHLPAVCLSMPHHYTDVVFWVTSVCSLVGSYQCVGLRYCFLLFVE